MIKLKLRQNKKSGKVKTKSHEYERKHNATRPQDHVINDKRRVWRSNPGYTLFQGHSRNSSNNSSYLSELEPVRFVNQLYLPDRYSYDSIVPEEHLNWNIPSKEDTFRRLEPAHQRNSRPNQNKHKHHNRNNSVDNPYSMDEFSISLYPYNGPQPSSMGESSFISNGYISFNGPIIFDPEIDEGTFPRNRMEQVRESRRNTTIRPTRHRSRSHDPDLVIKRYVEQPSHINPNPGIREYRPARRYKNQHLRELYIKPSREFIFDDHIY